MRCDSKRCRKRQITAHNHCSTHRRKAFQRLAGTSPDYGLLVFGSYLVTFTREDALAAGVSVPAGEDDTILLSAEDVGTNARLGEILTSAMGRHERKPGGSATIQGADGKPLTVPYFTWQTTVGGKTHYALMYVVLHEGAFIQVQVEGTRSFSNKQIEWFTTKLELAPPEIME